MEATFQIWKMEAGTPGVLTWFLPIITLFWIGLTVVSGVKAQKKKKWLEEKEEDEREIVINYKVGYITCWFNMGFLALLFFCYGTYGYDMLDPIYALVSVVTLNIIIFYGTKAYYLFYG